MAPETSARRSVGARRAKAPEGVHLSSARDVAPTHWAIARAIDHLVLNTNLPVILLRDIATTQTT